MDSVEARQWRTCSEIEGVEGPEDKVTVICHWTYSTWERESDSVPLGSAKRAL